MEGGSARESLLNQKQLSDCRKKLLFYFGNIIKINNLLFTTLPWDSGGCCCSATKNENGKEAWEDIEGKSGEVHQGR